MTGWSASVQASLAVYGPMCCKAGSTPSIATIAGAVRAKFFCHKIKNNFCKFDKITVVVHEVSF